MCSDGSGAARPCRLCWAWRIPGSRQLVVHGPHASVLLEPRLGVSLHRGGGVSARGKGVRRLLRHATGGGTFVSVTFMTL